ncbi:manganese efflux pump [Alicyclobacillus macrosporangiidus]|jgi:putative sporulation protein YtaF|uniref:Putative sporulation protein YtaF n=1 Tax=Alicyclobacillus macrosporangiidus TaxID=392015 RepID=A0A1I7KRS4_9BACL|nr:manganese efflux pump [Alicyclobacillus macrosporangiidus]SFV00119.1 putative sporulation protein YtaF [Alicyclobacillus macrosporangiidus]
MGSTVLTICAIALAANLDNASFGIVYGIRNIHISWWANAIIALISGVATLVAGWMGAAITRYVPPHLAAWTGAAVMWLVGLWVLTEPLHGRREMQPGEGNVVKRILRDPAAADFDHSHTLNLGEAVILGVAAALNALAGGFDAGVVHIGIVWTAAAVAVTSFVLLGAAAYVGRRYIAKRLGNWATCVAGLVMIAIGMHQIW